MAAVMPEPRFSVASVSAVPVRSIVPMLLRAPTVIVARPASTIASVAPDAVASVNTAEGSNPLTVPVPDPTPTVPVPPVIFGAFAPAPRLSVPSTTMPPCAVHVLPAATVAVAPEATVIVPFAGASDAPLPRMTRVFFPLGMLIVPVNAETSLNTYRCAVVVSDLNVPSPFTAANTVLPFVEKPLLTVNAGVAPSSTSSSVPKHVISESPLLK